MCKFGTNVVNGTYRNRNTIDCISPPADRVFLPDNFFITEDGGISWMELQNTNYNWTYYGNSLLLLRCAQSSFWLCWSIDDPTLSNISPSTGSPKGGEIVTITGHGFISDPDMLCSFGELGSSQAFFHSNTSLSCLSKPCTYDSCDNFTVYVEIALNGVQYTNSTALSFTYQSIYILPLSAKL